MTRKPLLTWVPVGLLLIAGSARADLSPYSVSVSETVEHDSNVAHMPQATPDWVSSTEVRGGVDQALGRDRLRATAAIDLERYRHSKLNNNGYDASAVFDWETVYDLSGSVGADSSRKLYVYGLNGEQASQGRNEQTTNHVFARGQLGGVTRWTLFGGVDGSQRKYSSGEFEANEVRQWSTNFGTRYQTSADLTFGLVGNYTRGEYPHAVLSTTPVTVTGREKFDVKSLDATSTLHASGNSSFDLRAGYTVEGNQFHPERKYWNGDIKWNWTATGHLKFLTELERDTDTDTSTVTGSAVTSSSLTGHSLNTTARINATYELSAKINIVGGAQYTQRRYSEGSLPVILGQSQPDQGSGSNRTTNLNVTVHYQPVLNTDLSCSFAHEVRRADAQVALATPAYTANNAQCAALIQFR